ncbi:putative bifunctional diguanylate cyclase/phosphodiesterase [Devosia sp. XGJD_8]|uniref:putative bifunctional diguanylate cyclase/phosphodiesterase n=1 Tax=Devosia sp. XGJD_8 TaxID=3391187 RepID=UPI00398486CA
MNRWFRLGLIAALLAGLIAMTAAGGLASQDKLLQDIRFSLAGLEPSGRTVLVEIDSKSLAEIGVWPWPRALYARLLDRLVAMDAAEMAFDIDFSSASTPDQDQPFADALARAGGYAWLGAFQQQTPEGPVLAEPLPAFLEHAGAASVNILLDELGLARQFLSGLSSDGSFIPALAHVLSGRVVEQVDHVGIDYGINANALARFSFIDVIEGRVAADAFRDRNVIVGATAVELRDFFQVPRFGTIPGPIVQALAVETLILDRPLRELGFLPSALVLGMCALMLAAFGGRIPIWGIGGLVLATMLAWEGISLIAYLGNAMMIDTAVLHAGLPVLFAAALSNEVGDQIRQRRAAQRRLAYLATHDETTGTLSRTGLVEALPRLGPVGTIILIKLRRLDHVRGTLGTDISDAVLRNTGTRLAAMPHTLLAYVAQDVFALCFDTALDDTATAAKCNDIRRAISGTQRVAGHGITIDIAMAHATGDNVERSLLRNARIALLHGEAGGLERNGFDPAQSQAIDRRRQIDLEMREAIAANQLSLVYQPQIDLRSRTIIGAEALMRWDHPQHGAISPADFIPLAEETGYIVELGRWALVAACRECASWPMPVRVAVNVSPAQLRLSDILGDVSHALDVSGLAPDRLDVEITEGALVEHLDDAQALLSRLKQIGVQLSLDDFGTGYSALSYLSTLPFDKIKIDQSFVRRLGRQPADDALLHTVVELCTRLGKVAVAEGIETEEQASQLLGWGCNFGQGYLLGRPISQMELRARLAGQQGTS